MATSTIPRGNYVVITTTFYDEVGNKTAPADTPVVHFSWPGLSTPAVASMTATADPAVWTLKWDTSPVFDTQLDYSVRALSTPGFYLVDDGTITLDINRANVQS